VTITSRNLQENASQIIPLAFVKIGVFSGGFQALFELGNGSGRLSLLFLASLSESGTGARVAFAFLVRDLRRCLYVDWELHCAGSRFQSHHLINVLSRRWW
jgi:hypothetical protein